MRLRGSTKKSTSEAAKSSGFSGFFFTAAAAATNLSAGVGPDVLGSPTSVSCGGSSFNHRQKKEGTWAGQNKDGVLEGFVRCQFGRGEPFVCVARAQADEIGAKGQITGTACSSIAPLPIPNKNAEPQMKHVCIINGQDYRITNTIKEGAAQIGSVTMGQPKLVSKIVVNNCSKSLLSQNILRQDAELSNVCVYNDPAQLNGRNAVAVSNLFLNDRNRRDLVMQGIVTEKGTEAEVHTIAPAKNNFVGNVYQRTAVLPSSQRGPSERGASPQPGGSCGVGVKREVVGNTIKATEDTVVVVKKHP